MLLISHRGNVSGVNHDRENSMEYIDEAISAGYDVEIDLWNIGGQLYLGHDFGQYPVDIGWLSDRANKLWIHTKNIKAAESIMDSGLRFFFHEKERHTLIYNSKCIWSHDMSEAGSKSIIPLLDKHQIATIKTYPEVHGVCSDFVATV